MTTGRSAGDGSPRVLVGLGETAGYLARLVEGFRELGVEADHLNLVADPMRYADGPDGLTLRLVRWLRARRRSGPGPRVIWATLHRIGLAWLFLDAIRRYDAFVLRGGDSFFALRDLRLLRRLGKTVVVVFFGSDSRPSYLNGAEIRRGQDGATAARITVSKRRVVAATERHVAHVVCHPMSGQLHRRPVVAFLEMGIPRRVPAEVTAPPAAAGGTVRFLHAPSRSADKGTDRVRAAVEAIAAEGVDVELSVVSGVPNAEVLEAIARSDVVIDQPYSDTPMAALSAEAAALGRPAIVGGYGWEELRAVTPEAAMPPTHLCHPDGLVDAVRRLATDWEYRLELGRRARRYVEERWAPAAVASRYLALIAGEAPDSWIVDPASVAYALGAGAPADVVAGAVRGVLEAAGPAGLAIEDRPELLDALLRLVSEESAAGRMR